MSSTILWATVACGGGSRGDADVEAGSLSPAPGAFSVDVPYGGLGYYVEAVESYCGQDFDSSLGQAGTIVNFTADECWPDCDVLRVSVMYANRGDDALYIAGFEEYAMDDQTSGAMVWHLGEESRPTPPGWWLLPEGASAVLLPGESLDLDVTFRLTCAMGSGDYTIVESGSAYDATFLAAWGTCQESADDVEKYGTCTPPLEPDTSAVNAAIQIVAG